MQVYAEWNISQDKYRFIEQAFYIIKRCDKTECWLIFLFVSTPL